MAGRPTFTGNAKRGYHKDDASRHPVSRRQTGAKPIPDKQTSLPHRALPADRQSRQAPPPGSGRRKPYRSKAITERRQRILNATMALIAEKGVDGFSLGDLSKRARVAQKTLYNSFGSKETLIAAAFDYFLEEQGERFPSGEKHKMADILAQLHDRSQDFMRNREWVRASNYLYFSFSVDPNVYASLKDMALIYFDQFCKVYGDDPDFVAVGPTAYTRMQMANTAHGTVHDWLMGRIADEAFPDAVCHGVAVSMAASLRGDLRKQAQELVEEIGARLESLPPPCQDNVESASGL